MSTNFLMSHDRFRSLVGTIVDMPERTIDLLIRFLRQHGGKLSGRARKREFGALSGAEVAAIENAYAETFGRL